LNAIQPFDNYFQNARHFCRAVNIWNHWDFCVLPNSLAIFVEQHNSCQTF
jgi:hypothetical protein